MRLADAWRVSLQERWRSRSTWHGAGIVALLCILNALRRNTHPYDSALKWFADISWHTLTTAVLSLLVAGMVVATYNRGPKRPGVRYPALVIAALASSGLGTAALIALDAWRHPESWSPMLWMASWPRYAVLALLFTFVYIYFKRAKESSSTRHGAERERLALEAQIEETRLQVLQAQIEPHFLFNTLATVRRLYRTEPGLGQSMLENLMQYLTVALPRMRATDSTLGSEASLAEAYLSVQRIRMGRRLTFAVDIAPALLEARLPPMMLLTLTENAIKHGLSPLSEGGFIRISARLDGDRLSVHVADSGRGFAETAGSGTGLANIRARLAASYGPLGRLALRRNEPRGVTATITLPFSRAAASVSVTT